MSVSGHIKQATYIPMGLVVTILSIGCIAPKPQELVRFEKGFRAVKPDMTRAQVAALLGEPQTSLEDRGKEWGVVPVTVVLYQSSNTEGRPALASILYVGDQVFDKQLSHPSVRMEPAPKAYERKGLWTDSRLVLGSDGQCLYQRGRFDKAEGSWVRMDDGIVRADLRLYHGRERQLGFEGEQTWEPGSNVVWHIWTGDGGFEIFADAGMARRYTAYKENGNRTAADLASDPHVYHVRGEVRMPGPYAFSPGVSLQDAVREAGGQTDFAHSTIRLIRGGSTTSLNGKILLQQGAKPFELEEGDAVVVLRCM